MPEDTNIEIKEGTIGISGSAFYACSNLATINIPKGVTNIGVNAFRGCNRLTAINIPEGVTIIEDRTFYGCHNLATINIPESVTSIGDGVFIDCIGLRDFFCHTETVPSTGDNIFYWSYPENATLHVPASAVENYRNAPPWNSFGSIVPITDIETGIQNSKFRIDNSELIYDLQGHRVTHTTKGIYIVNGKKTIIN